MGLIEALIRSFVRRKATRAVTDQVMNRQEQGEEPAAQVQTSAQEELPVAEEEEQKEDIPQQ